MCYACIAWNRRETLHATPRDPPSLLSLCVASFVNTYALKGRACEVKKRLSMGLGPLTGAELIALGVPEAIVRVIMDEIENELEHVRMCAAGHLYAAQRRRDYDYGFPDALVTVKCIHSDGKHVALRRSAKWHNSLPFVSVYPAPDSFEAQAAVEVCRLHNALTIEHRYPEEKDVAPKRQALHRRAAAVKRKNQD